MDAHEQCAHQIVAQQQDAAASGACMCDDIRATAGQRIKMSLCVFSAAHNAHSGDRKRASCQYRNMRQRHSVWSGPCCTVYSKAICSVCVCVCVCVFVFQPRQTSLGWTD